MGGGDLANYPPSLTLGQASIQFSLPMCCSSFFFCFLLSLWVFSLRQGLEDGVHLLGDGHEAELELLPRGDHPAPLVADVLERGRDVDLLAALRHPVEDHVDQDVGARAADPVAAKEMPRSVSRFVKKKRKEKQRDISSVYLQWTAMGQERPR